MPTFGWAQNIPRVVLFLLLRGETPCPLANDSGLTLLTGYST